MRFCLAAIFFVTSASATVILDGDFGSWTYVYSAAGGTPPQYVGSLIAAGGFPGANWSSSILDTTLTRAANMKSDYVNTAELLNDSFTLEFDAIHGSGFLQGAGLAIQQGSNYWYFTGDEEIVASFNAATWTHYTMTGTFQTFSFGIISGSGSPDFSSGTATRFGLYTHLQGVTPDLAYYDNFELTSNDLDAPAAVPEPSTWLLAILSLAALAYHRQKA
jgi:hypothetical protein